MKITKKRIILPVTAVAILAVMATCALLWAQGVFLPKWIEWKNVSITTKAYPEEVLAMALKAKSGKLPESVIADCSETITAVVSDKTIAVSVEGADEFETASDGGKIIWTLDKKCLVSDALFADIDRDGADELLVLCWKIGKYGYRKPFWITSDAKNWVQHVYIYEISTESVKPKWMSSNIGKNIASWRTDENGYIINTAPDGEESTWRWISWGPEKVDTSKNETQMQSDAGAASEDSDAAGLQTSAATGSGISNAGLQASDATTDSGISCTEGNAGLEDDIAEDELDLTEIIMVGDMLLHDGVLESCRSEEGRYDFSPLFAHTKDKIGAADLAIVNEEVIIGGSELRISGYPSFNAPFEVADALADAGFDVVCHATNHALDRGKKGIVNCLENWRSTHPEIAVIGIDDGVGTDGYAAENTERTAVERTDEGSMGKTAEKTDMGSMGGREKVYITTINGIKIAILNYTYGTNGISLPADMPYAVNLLNRDRIAEDLVYARNNADFVIVCPHWGIEYKLEATKEQEDMAKFMADNGADLIIGTHPHVIEPVEYVEGDEGGRALCYYSLGNYINWTSGRGANVGNRMFGYMADVMLTHDGDGRVCIMDYDAIPLVSHVESAKGAVSTYFLENYTQELAEHNEIELQDSNWYEFAETVTDFVCR